MKLFLIEKIETTKYTRDPERVRDHLEVASYYYSVNSQIHDINFFQLRSQLEKSGKKKMVKHDSLKHLLESG